MNSRALFFILIIFGIVVLTGIFFMSGSLGLDGNTERPYVPDLGNEPPARDEDNTPVNDDPNDPVNVALPPATLTTVMAWGYPGEPACNAYVEAADGRRIDVLKPEFFTVRDGGEFVFMTEELFGCNGYSASTTELVRSLSDKQFVTISSSFAGDMDIFLRRDETTGEHTRELVSFVVREQFEGVEIDFEDFGGWTPEIYERYKGFVTRLGNALNAEGKELMIDLPPVSNESEEGWYAIRLSDFENLPVDHLVIMAYDYQFDHGTGNPVAPLSWIEDVISFTTSRYMHHDRIVIGVPTYGYKSERGGRIQILTHEQAAASPGFETATRDPESGEMMWRRGVTDYVYQDRESISRKIETILASGIGQVSIWHLGGNLWFE